MSLDCVIYCACYSVLFRGGPFFSGHGVYIASCLIMSFALLPADHLSINTAVVFLMYCHSVLLLMLCVDADQMHCHLVAYAVHL